MSGTYISITPGSSGGSGGGGGGSGTVTQVGTGPGLTGGPITVSGSVSIASVSLSNQVTGVLPISMGGTGSQTAASALVSLGAANNTLSNLVSSTSANVDIVPNGDQLINLGGPGRRWINAYITNIKSDSVISQTGSLDLESLTVASGNSQNIILSPGAAPGTRGSIQFEDGTEGTAGAFWKSKDTSGNGNWAILGSISLSSGVSGNLPLTQTTGSISLTNRVSGVLPNANMSAVALGTAAQVTGSISLTNQVSGVLPNANMSSVALGNAAQVTGSVSLVNQVSGSLSLTTTNGVFTSTGDLLVGSASGAYARLPVGGTGQVLTAINSNSSLSVSWNAPPPLPPG